MKLILILHLGQLYFAENNENVILNLKICLILNKIVLEEFIFNWLISTI